MTSPLRSPSALGVSKNVGCPPGRLPLSTSLFRSFSLEDPLSPLGPDHPASAPTSGFSPESHFQVPLHTQLCTDGASHLGCSPLHSALGTCPADRASGSVHSPIHSSILSTRALSYLWLFLCWVSSICQILFMLLPKWLYFFFYFFIHS